jgi:hypothetical protein
MPTFVNPAPEQGDSLSVVVNASGQLGARHDSQGRRRVGTTTAPSVAVGGNAGSGSSATVVGTDEAGVITVVAGTGAAAGTLATLTFATAFAVAPVFSLDAGDQYGAAANLYANSTTTTLVVKAAGTPASSQTYKINYINVGGA